MRVIIVGSGFGGSVMAYRLAREGHDVTVLERGKQHKPGEFPRLLQGVHENFWDPSARLFGLFNVWFFRRVGALVASGVGGGSLIYANVMLRKDPAWFDGWPVTRDDLDPHYNAVAEVLTPVPYRGSATKVTAFRDAANRLAHGNPHLSVIEPPLAISFDKPAPEPNLHGIEREACTGCGECIVGCNTGAKNTLDLTYLSRSRAEIKPNHEVKSFRPISNNQIEVECVEHPAGTRHRFTCDKLVISAGTFGSTYLMMRNIHAFGEAKPLGTRFSGNGDLLSFALLSTKPDGNPWRFDPTRGPTITTALRHADVLDRGTTTERGFYIEDAGFPHELAWLVEGLQAGGWVKRGARFARELFRKAFGADPDNDLGKELSDLLGEADLSSRTMPLLAMGRDVADGVFALDGQRLRLEWSRKASAAYFQRVEDTARDLAHQLGATFLKHPPTYFFGRAVTVHPLGGCPMGTHAGDGVVDSYGKSFVHDGLYVVDGSIMPGAVGPNPAFTIAALADRAATRMLH